jgi:hypothetical protein
MKDAIDIIVFIIVNIVSFHLGRCSGLYEKEFKRLNKIGHNPSPPDDFKKPKFPSRNNYRLGKYCNQPNFRKPDLPWENKMSEPAYEPPEDTVKVKLTSPPIRTIKNG